MARPFLSNCRRSEPCRTLAHALLLPLFVALLAACTAAPGTRPLFDRQPDENAAATYLLGLREYLTLPAGEQAAHRERLRVAAEEGQRGAQLAYALSLSVDRDERVHLQQARAYFEKLLASPDPLPVELDALVRLQLGQVIDRLERMKRQDEIHDAYRAAARGQQMCLVQLERGDGEREALRRELADVRRKLDALTRIEQTVNDSQESQRLRRAEDGDDENARDDRENDNAER